MLLKAAQSVYLVGKLATRLKRECSVILELIGELRDYFLESVDASLHEEVSIQLGFWCGDARSIDSLQRDWRLYVPLVAWLNSFERLIKSLLDHILPRFELLRHFWHDEFKVFAHFL